MRVPALTIATVLTAAPARAQTYDPSYPVCLHVWAREATYYECRYTSLPQCNASASGRSSSRMCGLSFRREFSNDWWTSIFPL